ncbi:MAG TPA: EamA family transporter [Alphaproteobacteria bacterium]|jgi:drug/metabolite transporter (DMT)-like permease|nr:EamA family transporter [Alphaproteobacteria bacterium]MDP7164852.1 EamA family transporter [Alphaproteobacteria bacterium]MDP7427541.1 EamA family transporter [Alphaproteobacteria bacterium]HJM51915.1 EamA family transporter [Alphaproteobacteria bacterium]|tara:strand:+ start:76 stop:978 length:903 start_codon:yes stop_codon:yes gene_type:complete
MDAWIAITIAAAFFQNLRMAVQKHLTARLSTAGATSVRFYYAFPLAALYALAVANLTGQALPPANTSFVLYAMVGGGAQIVATALLVSLFSLRNFAVGTTFSKTETVQAAVFGIVILSDPLSAWALAGILVSLAGVMAISMARGKAGLGGLARGLSGRPALLGMASGAAFAVSVVSYRAAALSLESGGVALRAGLTLAVVTVMQTIAMTVYLRWREPGQISLVFRSWRVSVWAGIFGTAASACWFTAFTLQNAAYVRAVGQVELVFTFAISYFFFRERATPVEIAGILLVVAGILVLLQG